MARRLRLAEVASVVLEIIRRQRLHVAPVVVLVLLALTLLFALLRILLALVLALVLASVLAARWLARHAHRACPHLCIRLRIHIQVSPTHPGQRDHRVWVRLFLIRRSFDARGCPPRAAPHRVAPSAAAGPARRPALGGCSALRRRPHVNHGRGALAAVAAVVAVVFVVARLKVQRVVRVEHERDPLRHAHPQLAHRVEPRAKVLLDAAQQRRHQRLGRRHGQRVEPLQQRRGQVALLRERRVRHMCCAAPRRRHTVERAREGRRPGRRVGCLGRAGSRPLGSRPLGGAQEGEQRGQRGVWKHAHEQ